MPTAPFDCLPSIIEVTQGSYSSSAILLLRQAGWEPINLTNADSVNLEVTAPDGTTIVDNYELGIYSVIDGMVTYSPVSQHVGTTGTFSGEIVINWNDTTKTYIPSRGTLVFVVHPGVT